MWTGITNPNLNHYCHERNLEETHQSHQTLIVWWDQVLSREEGGLGEKILGEYMSEFGLQKQVHRGRGYCSWGANRSS